MRATRTGGSANARVLKPRAATRARRATTRAQRDCIRMSTCCDVGSAVAKRVQRHAHCPFDCACNPGRLWVQPQAGLYATEQKIATNTRILRPVRRETSVARALSPRLPVTRIRELNSSEQTLFDRLLAVTARFGREGAYTKYVGEEPPLRSALFSADQMEQRGRNLALAHRLAAGHADRLLARLAENDGVLVEVCDLLTKAVTANRRITPAAEWLLDNFYLVEEQIRTARRHLPKGYSRELPRLANGPSAGLPRVYDLAFETISHGDGRVDAEGLSRFVAAYQTVSPLALGELWAIPIMLRLALIENLRRVGARIAGGTIDRSRAAAWADQMREVAEHDPKSLILAIADMARSNPPMVSAFVAELARLLQGHSAALALPLTWIEQRLAESGETIEQLVQAEAQEQARDQVSISNTIGSLRFLGSMDWREFVETMSAVEKKLREDPGGLYGRMDFATRDRYRHVIEEIAKSSPLSESDVARKAIQLAHEGATGTAGKDGDDDRAAHVGFYLIDKGRPRLERAVDARPGPAEVLRRIARRVPLLLYLGAIAAITGGLTAVLTAMAHADGVSDAALVPLAVFLLLATSQLGLGMVNWIATLLVTPRPLPRMAFDRGLPSQSRTLVVVPTMLTSVENIESLVEALEVRFLANRDDNLHFGLLTDFPDASTETLPEDESLLQLARNGIESLNGKYRPAAEAAGNHGNGDTFLLFHRPRRWNPEERIWMGYERKRGKLADLNALLRGGATDAFSLVVGDTAPLSNVKYVITLDTDTQLPRDAARQFVGVMAHPLNRARFDGSGARPGAELVTEGYGILQPRVSVSLPGANRSWFARMHAGDPGIDPYTRAVSDVYQDVFGEGSFIGKGIYDVDAFERALGGRFPENRILSHDLLEGCYARSGLLSDVQLYEEYPSTYGADISRRHRWIRGDWQLAGWLLSRVPGPGNRRLKNPLSALSQWKLFDNLRRSLVPAALTALLLLGWTVLPGAWLWTLVVIGILLLPSACAVVLDLLRKPDEVLLRQHLATTAGIAGRHLGHAAAALAFLPYEATVHLDAIARTAWRMLVSHRRLLEWNPSAADESDRRRRGDTGGRSGLAASVRSMWIAPVIATATTIQLAASAPAALRECRTDPPPVVPLAGHRVVDQSSARARRSAPDDGADDLPAQGRAQDLGVLRDLRRPGRPLAAAGQLPGTSGRQRRASHVADEHGHGVAGQSDGLRLRLRPGRTTRQAHGKCAGHDDDDGTPPGTLLQLVRHAVPAATAAALCLGGRQRQPRGSPDDPACGTACAARRQDRGCAVVRGTERHAAVARRRGRRSGADPARSTADGSRDRIRLPSHHAHGGAAMSRPDRRERRRSGRARPRQLPTRMLQAPLRPRATRSSGRTPSSVSARSLRDELAFLAPWSALPAAPRGLGDLLDSDAIPTLRALAVPRRRVAAGHRAPTSHGRAAGGTRVARRLQPRHRRVEPSRRRANAGDRRSGVAMRGAGPTWSTTSSTTARVTCWPSGTTSTSAGGTRAITTCSPRRRGSPASSRLPRASCRRKTGSRSGGCSHRGRPIGAPVVERLDVRVPDAAAGDAGVREHAARADLSRDGRAADRVREAARRAVGHLGIRIQLGRRESQLPVPRLRRAGPGVEARARRGSRRRALRVGARADGGARGLVPQPAAPRRRRARRAIRPLRGGRLHRRPRAARADERHRALLHGAPPGHDPALPVAPAARPSDAEALRIGAAVQGHAAAAPGTHSEDRRVLFAPRGAVGHARHLQRPGGARARDRHAAHADTGSAAALERPLPRHGHECGRRQLALEGSRRHALARGRHLRPLGHVLLHPRRGERRLLVDRAPADGQAPAALRGDLHRVARGVPPARRRLRVPHRDRRLAGRRHRAAPAPRHQPLADAADDRRDQLRGSRARAARRGRAASGVLQSVRADRDRRAATGHPVHAAVPLGGRAAAVDVPPDGRARRRCRRRLLRDRPDAVHRPRTHRRRAAGDDRSRDGCRAAKGRSWTRSSRYGTG